MPALHTGHRVLYQTVSLGFDAGKPFMTEVTIYHNPACGTSRNTLALTRKGGLEPKIIKYLKPPPSGEELVALIRKGGLSVRAAMRTRGTPYRELGLDDP